MTQTTQKAILVVSFGTSYKETCKATIGAIEREIARAYPDYRIYRAWTSRMILAKIRNRDNVHIDNVQEAVERMLADGIREVIVQPTHIIDGIENDTMRQEILPYMDSFDSVCFGRPLLNDEKDSREVMQAVAQEFSDLKQKEALVLMGHGTSHRSNAVYAALDDAFKDFGHPNIFLGTVEACPAADTLIKLVKDYAPEKVILAPFMIVAGDHAQNDMAGDDPNSWYSLFTAEGFQVEPVLRGLGEYPAIRSVIVSHIEDAIRAD